MSMYSSFFETMLNCPLEKELFTQKRAGNDEQFVKLFTSRQAKNYIFHF